MSTPDPAVEPGESDYDDGLTDPRVSTFELFFDLVFVFAFTRITEAISHDPTWTGLARGVVIFALLWWAWAAYAWLTNSIHTDDLVPRLILLTSMAAMLVVALAVPTAFEDSGVAFGLGYLMVFVLHAGLFVAAGDDPTDSARGILRLAPNTIGAALLLVVAGTTDGTAQTVLWATAIFTIFVGPYITGVADFTVRPAHFVERHGLIVIIALGESIVALAAVSTDHVDWSLAATATVAVALISGLWWAYFAGEADEAEHALRAVHGADRSRLARDLYSYLHNPLVLGVILAALGIKKTFAHSDEELSNVAAVALGGGVALYFAALVGVRLRRGTKPGVARLAAVALALLAIPVATEVPAIASLSGLAVLTLTVALVDHRPTPGPAGATGADATAQQT